MARPVTIAMTGDVMLGRMVAEVIPARGPAYPWGDLVPGLTGADLLLINLECALTEEREPSFSVHPKRFWFRAEPEQGARTLAEAGVDFAALANNHIGDFGLTGMIDTIATLDRWRVAHAGAGVNLAAARMPARLSANGLRVSVVAFADYPGEWAASDDSPGMSYLPVSTDPAVLRVVDEAVATAREESDLVIFSIHWGPNMRAQPTPGFRSFARRVIEAGADVFWGHSAHVVQGVEIWNGKPILYDTGDFVDDYAVDPELRNDRSALFLIRIVPPVLERIDLLPVEIGDCQVNRASPPARDWFMEWFTARCAELGTEPFVAGEMLTIPLGLRLSRMRPGSAFRMR